MSNGRGAGKRAITLDESIEDGRVRYREELLAVSEALRRLAEIEPRLATVVECRFYAGMDQRHTCLPPGTDSSGIVHLPVRQQVSMVKTRVPK